MWKFNLRLCSYPQSYLLLPEMDAQGGAAPEAPIPCLSCNTTWQHLQDFTLSRFSLRATELLESAMAIVLLPAQRELRGIPDAMHIPTEKGGNNSPWPSADSKDSYFLILFGFS